MAAPSASYRVMPPTAPMKDGYRSLVTFAADTNILLWEKGVTPFGVDGGEPIDVNTMWSGTWFIERPRQLKRTLPLSMRCAYYPLVYSEIIALVNVETTITQWFPSGNYVAFYGYLQSFTPDESVEGSQPEATAVVKPTMWDATNGVEANPVVGTGT